MRFHKLGWSPLHVSEICLGTMTWGIQNTQSDADRQLNIAVDYGVNFIDTAEMYPVPPNADTYGRTEEILGDWLSRHQHQRDRLIVMTKMAGAGLAYIRQGQGLNGADVPLAIDKSLKRLRTDYIDVYQLHWPNRVSPHFGKHWPDKYPVANADVDAEISNMRSVLIALKEAISVGKIRYWGLSDETPWGIHTYLRLCDELDVPRPVSIQNEFSLLHLKDWPYVVEVCVNEAVSYLPWSPLATGMLTGKYLNGARPTGSRWTLMQRLGLFRDTDMARQATAAYVDVATRHGLTPTQLALAWCRQVPGVTSTIIGATSTEQLIENIEAFRLELSMELSAEIAQVIRQFPSPF